MLTSLVTAAVWFFLFFFGQFLFSRYSLARCCCRRRNPKWKISKQERETNLISSSTISLRGLSVLYPARVSFSFLVSHFLYRQRATTIPPRETTYSLYSSYSVARRAPGVGCCWLNWSVVRLNYHGNRGERCRREPFFFTGIIFFLFFSDLFSLFLSHTLIDLYFVVF